MYIISGINIKNNKQIESSIQYVNISQTFVIKKQQKSVQTFNYQCITTYNEINNYIKMRSYSCQETSGITCINGKMLISYNYWAQINDPHHKYPFKNETDKSIISKFCPAGYCSQIEYGCDVKLKNKEKYCEGNRSFIKPLCGSCINGY